MRRHCKSAFTLIELLVVISIVALLLAVLLPVLEEARDTARRVLCASNLRQNALAASGIYATDYNATILPAAGIGPVGRNPYYGFRHVASADNRPLIGNYSVNMWELLDTSTPVKLDENPPIEAIASAYCPSAIDWRNTPSGQRETSYGLVIGLSYQKLIPGTLTSRLSHTRTDDIRYVSEAGLLVETHQKGARSVRNSYSQAYQTDWVQVPALPQPYNVANFDTFESPARHSGGLNISYIDGHVSFFEHRQAVYGGQYFRPTAGAVQASTLWYYHLLPANERYAGARLWWDQ